MDTTGEQQMIYAVETPQRVFVLCDPQGPFKSRQGDYSCGRSKDKCETAYEILFRVMTGRDEGKYVSREDDFMTYFLTLECL